MLVHLTDIQTKIRTMQGRLGQLKLKETEKRKRNEHQMHLIHFLTLFTFILCQEMIILFHFFCHSDKRKEIFAQLFEFKVICVQCVHNVITFI